MRWLRLDPWRHCFWNGPTSLLANFDVETFLCQVPFGDAALGYYRIALHWGEQRR